MTSFKWFTRDDILEDRRCREDVDPEIDRRKEQRRREKIRAMTNDIGRGTNTDA